jgi:hypothetical protein
MNKLELTQTICPEGLIEEFESLYKHKCLFCGICLNLHKWTFGKWDNPGFYFWGCPNYLNNKLKCFFKKNLGVNEEKVLVKLFEKYLRGISK